MPKWQLNEESDQRHFARRRGLDLLWQVLSAVVLAAVIYGAYLFAGQL